MKMIAKLSQENIELIEAIKGYEGTIEGINCKISQLDKSIPEDQEKILYQFNLIKSYSRRIKAKQFRIKLNTEKMYELAQAI